MRPLILASASPRRQALVGLLARPVQILIADVDERGVLNPDPAGYVLAVARLKASKVANLARGDGLVVAADTMVVLDGQLLGKPDNKEEAWEMLRRLRGRIHQVYTAVAVVDLGSGREVSDVAQMNVRFRDYSDQEIADYIATGDPLDKAGAYAIQHSLFRPVLAFDDCYAGVVGFPLCHLTRLLRQLGEGPTIDIAAACQTYHHYHCPVFPTILGLSG